MIDHARFIEQLRQMHFNAGDNEVLKRIIQALRLRVLKELQQQKENTSALLETISSGESLQNFDAQIKRDLQSIRLLIENIQSTLGDLPTPSDTILDNPDDPLWLKFDEEFGNYFPNLQLLVHTLSDAPPAIKAQLTPLVIGILDKIKSKDDQKAALQTLTDQNLQDIIAQSQQTYDGLSQYLATSPSDKYLLDNWKDDVKRDERIIADIEQEISEKNNKLVDLLINMNKIKVVYELTRKLIEDVNFKYTKKINEKTELIETHQNTTYHTKVYPLVEKAIDLIKNNSNNIANEKQSKIYQLTDKKNFYENNYNSVKKEIDEVNNSISILNDRKISLSNKINENKTKIATQKEEKKQSTQIENKSANTILSLRCKSIVQLSIAELVYRESSNSENLSDYASRKACIDRIKDKIPDVRNSTILDDISATHPEIEVDIRALIAEPINWQDPDALSLVQSTQALYQKLRFGQKDFREYIAETKKRLGTDLFWAENIYETRLFPKKDGDRLYQEELNNYCIDDSNAEVKKINDEIKNLQKNTRNPFPAEHPIRALKEDDEKYIRLLYSINQTFKYFKDNKIEKNNKIVPPSLGDLKNKFNDYFLYTPQIIRKNKSQKLFIKFYENTTKEYNDILDNAFNTKNCIGYDVVTFSKHLMPANIDLLEKTSVIEVSGYSLQEITSKLQNNHVKKYIEDTFPDKSISTLDLPDEKALSLQKLLELHQFQTGYDNSLMELFFLNKEFVQGLLSQDPEIVLQALDTVDLNSKIDDAYRAIAALPENLFPSSSTDNLIINRIWSKAQKIVGSTKRKKELAHELEKAWSMDDPETRRQKVIDIYKEEYNNTAILETLDIFGNAIAIAKMNDDIEIMATDFDRLISRIENGEDLTSTEENLAYLEAIQQIAKTLPKGQTFAQIGFKLSHKLQKGDNKITIQLGEKTQEITISLRHTLPYSLIKPAGYDDFELSMGGSRGVVAPFAELDKAYGRISRKQGFKNFKLIGEGQQGTVKQLRNFITHASAVLKKVYLETNNQSTFKASARNKQETLPISARDDSQFAVEAEIVVAQSLANQDKSQQAMSYILIDKPKKNIEKSIFNVVNPRQGYLIMPKAPGRSYQQIANDRLKIQQRDQAQYHNPTAGQDKQLVILELQDKLNLSTAILAKADQLHSAAVVVTHNDIKPENFNAEKRPDGTWHVNFTDWGTGGFSAIARDKASIPASFQHLIPKNATPSKIPSRSSPKTTSFLPEYFVKNNTDGSYSYGVNPHLEILGGHFHCTLAYISPKITTYPKNGNVSIIPANDETLDNWALTTMLFGICNKKAYLEFSKGRANQYYAIPGILEEINGQLKIVNVAKFNEFFGVRFSNEQGYNDDIMFIPGSTREGEPLHLYRRLVKIASDIQTPAEEKEEIEVILAKVANAVASGEGLDKQTLKETVANAQKIIEALDPEAKNAAEKSKQSAQARQERLAELWKDELSNQENLATKLKDLCTLPTNTAQITQSQEKIKAIIGKIAPQNYENLLKECIAAHQETILLTLLKELQSTESKNALPQQIITQELFHYALQEGLNQAAEALYAILPQESQQIVLEKTEFQSSAIRWQGSALDSAIRRRDLGALTFLLKQYSAYNDNAALKKIKETALHTAATLGNIECFAAIKTHFNITDAEILAMNADGQQPSPYHLFLQSNQANTSLPWEYWQINKQAAKQFLLNANPDTPCLIAVESANLTVLWDLLALGQSANLNSEEWLQLFGLCDAKGKNIANYLTENPNISRAVLPNLINTINSIPTLDIATRAKILKNLLFNNAPNNPITNILANPKSNSAENKAWMLELKKAILPEQLQNHQPREMVEVYYGLLINNTAWLIKETQELSEITAPSSVDWIYPYILMSQIAAQPGVTPAIQEKYKQIAENLKNQHPDEALSAEDNRRFRALEEEVARRTADISVVLRELSASNVKNNRLSFELRIANNTIDRQKKLLDDIQPKLTGKENDLRSKIDQLDTANQNIANLTARLNHLTQTQSEDYKKTTADLNAAISGAQKLLAEKEDLVKEVGELSVAKAKLESVVLELQEEIKGLLTNSTILSEENFDLQQRITALETHTQNLSNDLADKTEESTQLLNVLHKKEKELLNIQAQRTESDKESTQRITTLNEEITLLRANLQNNIDAITRLEEQNRALQTNGDQLQRKLENTEQTNEDLLQELNNVRQQLANNTQNAQATIDNLQTEILTLQQRIIALETYTQNLSNDLADKTEESIQLLNALHKKEKELLNIQAQRTESDKESTQRITTLNEEITLLRANLQNNIDAITRLEEQNRALQTNGDQLQRKLENTEQTNEDLLQELNNVRQQLANNTQNAQATIDNLQTEILTLQQRIIALETYTQNLSNDLADKTEESTQLLNALHNKEQELLNIQAQMTESDKESTQRITTLNEEITLLRANLQNNIDAITRLEEQNRALQTNGDQLQRKLENTEQTNEDLLQELNNVRQQLANNTQNAQATIDNLQTEILTLQQRIIALETHTQNLSNDLADKTEESIQLLNALHKKEKELLNIQAQMTESDKESTQRITTLNEEITLLRANLQNNIDAITRLEEQNRALQTNGDQLQRKLENTEQTNEDLLQELNNVRQQLANNTQNAQATIDNLQTEILTLQQRIIALETHTQNLSNDLADKTEESIQLLNALHNKEQELLNIQAQMTESDKESTQRITTLNEEITLLRANLQNNIDAITRLEEQNRALQTNGDQLQRKLENTEQTNEDLLQELNNVRQQLANNTQNAQATIDNLQTEILTLQQRIIALETYTQNLSNDLADKTEESTQLLNALHNKEQELLNIQAQMTESDKESTQRITTLNEEITLLRANLQNNIDAITRLEEQNRALQTNGDQLQRKLENTEQTNEDLLQELNNVRQQLANNTQNAQATIDNLQTEILTLQQRIIALETYTQNLSNDLADKTEESTQLLNALHNKEQELLNIQAQMTESDKESTQRITTLNEEITLLRANLQNNIDAITRLEEQNRALQTNGDQLQRELENTDQRNEHLLQELNNVHQQLDNNTQNAQATIDNLQTEILTLQQRIIALETYTQNLSNDLADKTEESTQLLNALHNKEQELLNIQAQMTESDKESTQRIAALNEKITLLRANLQNNIDAITRLEEQNRALQTNGDQLQRELENTDQRNEHLLQELNNVHQQLANNTQNAQITINNLRTEILTLQQRIIALETYTQNLSNDLADKTEESTQLLNALHNKEQELLNIQAQMTESDKESTQRIAALNEKITLLRANLQNNIDAIARLEEQNRALQTNGDQLQRELENTDQRNEHLLQELNNVHQQLDNNTQNAQATIDNLQTEILTLQQRIIALETYTQNLSNDLADKTEESTQLLNALHNKEQELLNIQAQMTESDKESTQRITTLNEEITLLRANLQNNIDAITRLEEQNRALQTNGDQLQRKLENTEQTNEDLLQELNNVRQQLANNTQNAQITINNLREKIITLEDKIANLTTETETLKYELEKTNRDNSEAMILLLQTQQALDNAQIQAANGNKAADNTIQILKSLSLKLTHKLQKNERIVNKLREENNLLKTTVNDLSQKLQESDEKHFDFLFNKINDAKKTLNDNQNDSEKIENEINSLKNELEKKKGLIDKLAQSNLNFQNELMKYIKEIDILHKDNINYLNENCKSKHDLEIAQIKNNELLSIIKELQIQISASSQSSQYMTPSNKTTSGSVNKEPGDTDGESSDDELVVSSRSILSRGNTPSNRFPAEDQNLSVTRKKRDGVPEPLDLSKAASRQNFDQSSSANNIAKLRNLARKYQKANATSQNHGLKNSNSTSLIGTSSIESTRTAKINIHRPRELSDVQKDIAKIITDNMPEANSQYKNEIIDNQYVSLIYQKTSTDLPQKLLHATVDKVTVYRRLTDDQRLSVEKRANIILKSMGVPPEEGVEPPDTIMINGSSSASLIKQDGSQMAQVSIKIFELFEEWKNQQYGIDSSIVSTPSFS